MIDGRIWRSRETVRALRCYSNVLAREYGQVRCSDKVEHAKDAVRHVYQVRFADFVSVSMVRVGVLVQKVEVHSHRDGSEKHHQR